MGCYINTYINLKIKQQLSLNQIDLFIKELIENQFISGEKITLISNFERDFTSYFSLKDKHSDYTIIFKGENKSLLFEKINEVYPKNDICICFEMFHPSLKDKFENQSSYQNYFFGFFLKNEKTIEVAEANSLDKFGNELYPNKLDSTTVYYQSNSKSGPNYYDIAYSKIGKYCELAAVVTLQKSAFIVHCSIFCY